VSLLAVSGGAGNAHTLRAAASSVAPIATAIGAPCVLASLGVDAGIHLDHEEAH
jgi:hypothetical protein